MRVLSLIHLQKECTKIKYVNESVLCRINVKDDSTIQQMLQDVLDSGFFGLKEVTTDDIQVLAAHEGVDRLDWNIPHSSIVSHLRRPATEGSTMFHFQGK